MASTTDIANCALSKLGAARIQALTDQSVNARACNACYELLRDAELAANPWNFSIQRFALAADATALVFGGQTAYPLPTGWLRILPPDPASDFRGRDWTIEGQSILTTMAAPLNVRCVMSIADTSKFSVMFIEAVACRMAFEMCEQLTQSNTKKDDCRTDYKTAINEAKKQNAIQKVPQISPDDTWATARYVAGYSRVPGSWYSVP